jgi:Tol biopolymer transport system component
VTPVLGACAGIAGLTDLPAPGANDSGVGAANGEEASDGAGRGNDSAEAAVDSDGGDAGRDAGNAACDPSHPFGTPTQGIFAPYVNVPGASTFDAHLSPDQLTMYFTWSLGGAPYRLYVTTRPSTTAAFLPPAEVPGVNDPDASGARDESPSVSGDGTTLLLTSDRDSIGDEHLYIATGGPAFAKPVPLTGVNSAASSGLIDVMGYLVPDGHEIYFARGDATYVESQIYRALLSSGGTFGSPSVVPELNGASALTQHPTVTPDDRTVFYSSNRQDLPGTQGALDIFYATRADAAGPFGASAALMDLNSPQNDLSDWISPDGCTLYFSSNRPNPFGTDYEIYVATRQ